jgi:hypothetical protein
VLRHRQRWHGELHLYLYLDQAGTTFSTTLSSTTAVTIHGCSSGKTYSVTVTVRNSAGATAADGSGYTCADAQ